MEPRIKKILKTDAYKIFSLWNNNEIRLIDLEQSINEHIRNRKGLNIYQKLIDKQIFAQVHVNEEIGTLCWQNLLPVTDTDGKNYLSDFDICPDVLYSMSTPCSI